MHCPGAVPGDRPPWGATVLPTQPCQPPVPACSLSILRVLQDRGWWWSPSRAVSQGPFAAPVPQPCVLPDNCSQHSPLAFVRVNDGLCNQDGNEQQVKLICKDAEATLLFNFMPFFSPLNPLQFLMEINYSLLCPESRIPAAQLLTRCLRALS